MRKKIKYIICLFAAALMLAGCSMQTVDQMYQLPKRSEDYSNLQFEIDKAMAGLVFSAPLAGENQQSVQIADVDGDGDPEYLVFTKSNAEQPLRILVFNRIDGVFVHTDTIKSNGAAFDQVEYIQMDRKPGLEVVVGCQVSDQLVRSVSVYSFASGVAEQLLSADYRSFVTVDMDDNGLSELFLLRPGEGATDNGVAELYSIRNGVMERSNEANMSVPAEKLKRVHVGKLIDGASAIFVTGAAVDGSHSTDIYTKKEGMLVSTYWSGIANPEDVKLFNNYLYADDIDNDGVVELPSLVTLQVDGNISATEQRDVICWYTMGSNGTTTEKLYTYHDLVGGWFLKLNERLARRIIVRCVGNTCEFYLYFNQGIIPAKLMTVYTFTGQNREEQSISDGRFVLYKTDAVIYSASLENIASDYFITQQSMIHSFHLIRQVWKTGEM